MYTRGTLYSQMSGKRTIILVVDQEEGNVGSSCSISGSQGRWILILKRLMPTKLIRLFSLTGPSRVVPTGIYNRSLLFILLFPASVSDVWQHLFPDTAAPTAVRERVSHPWWLSRMRALSVRLVSARGKGYLRRCSENSNFAICVRYLWRS